MYIPALDPALDSDATTPAVCEMSSLGLASRVEGCDGRGGREGHIGILIFPI